MAWTRKRKQALMVFKVDFEKAFDSLGWEFLELVMAKLGFGVRVSDEEVSNMANVIGCGAAKFPLKYLGVPVGCNMSVLGNLPTYYMSIYMIPIFIQKKLESMRNNFFICGDLEEKKMTLVKWKKCLANKDLGGLGIGSIYGLNLGLLFKWVWRFLCNSPDLWVRVIKNLHGAHGGVMEDSNYSSCYSPWSGILASISSLKLKGIELLSLCVRKIGNGVYCRFWDDIWCGNQLFKLQFPRIYQLEIVKDCSIADRIGIPDWTSVFRRPPQGGAEMSQFNDLLSLIQDVALSDFSDSWIWSVDASNGYTVASARTLIDSNILDVAPNATRWNRLIPNKVNVFIWRLMLNKLPTRVNLDRRDIDVGSILCPICIEDVETANHIFLSCNMAKDLWSLFAKWWEIDILVYANISEWFVWLDDLAVSNKVRSFIDGVGDSLMWHIWKFRNELIFSSSPSKKALIWDFIVSHSFLWFSSKNPKCNFSWGHWLQNPLTYTTSL
nr:RNA-directed DNA polymerase, eukaryota, reverse transcriptase zinc-binding domain protein [Tanacetum cinerariifolium]